AQERRGPGLPRGGVGTIRGGGDRSHAPAWERARRPLLRSMRMCLVTVLARDLRQLARERRRPGLPRGGVGTIRGGVARNAPACCGLKFGAIRAYNPGSLGVPRRRLRQTL